MMTKNEKKEIFLLIIENWFNDKTGHINTENCIGFYHYFIDCLEFESRFSPEYAPGFNNFILLISQWLSDFDKILDIEINKEYIEKKDGIKILSSSLFGEKNPEKLELFLTILNDLYIMFKDEYLL